MYRRIIRPGGTPISERITEIYHYRELLLVLSARDLKIRYAQTSIGFAWAVINPILQILVLSFIFGSIAKVGTGPKKLPHIIFTSIGMCGWSFFANIFSSAGQSIIASQQMIKKVYFPRLIIPISKTLSSLVDLVIMVFLVIILVAFYELPISKNIVYLPIFLFLAMLAGLTGGLFISALSIRYRDLIHISPLLLMLGMYLTPISFPSSIVPDKYQFIFHLNPMVGVVEGIRWCFVGGNSLDTYLLLSTTTIILFFLLSILYFTHIERKIADII